MDKCFKTFQATYHILKTILKSGQKKCVNKNHCEKRGLFICESNNYEGCMALIW
jgi:hypothetical protein